MTGKFYLDRYETSFRKLVQAALRTGAPVLDVGRGHEYGENQFDGYGISPPEDIEYLTLDVRPEPAPDFVADLSQLPLEDSQLSIVFVESVLEHVDPVSNLDNCMEEIHRVLIEDGLVVGWVPFCFPFHGREFPDGTRFTYDGVERLLNDFSDTWIQPCGGPLSVFLASIPRYGDTIRTNGLEKYETKLRFALLEGILSEYQTQHEKSLNSVGFRFFAKK